VKSARENGQRTSLSNQRFNERKPEGFRSGSSDKFHFRRWKMPKRKNAKPTAPNVGIVFLVGKTLLIDRTPVSEGGIYGDFRIHERGHDAFWEMLRRTGAVPPDTEYDDYPRGRVAYNTKTGKYSLLLDRCILKNKSVVNKIMSELNLPTKRTEMDTDSQYRCPNCLGRGR
jgi:hypothetical protein